MSIKIHSPFEGLSSEGANLTKIIATFCVVLVHSYNIFSFAKMGGGTELLSGFRTLASAGVPVFFLLAGYFLMLSGKYTWKSNILKKIKSLLVPYLVFMLIYTVLNCAGYIFIPAMFDGFYSFSFFDWLDHLFGIPFCSTPKYYEPFWFLRDLFLLNVMSGILVPIVRKTQSCILIPMMIILMFTPLPSYTRQPLSFFIIGMCLGNEQRFPVIKSHFASLALFALSFSLTYISDSRCLSTTATLLMTLAILSISNCLIHSDSIKRATAFLIPYSFFTYTIHQHPLTLAQKLLVMKMNITFPVATLLYFVLPFMIIGACVAVGYFFKRVSPRTYAICVGNRH